MGQGPGRLLQRAAPRLSKSWPRPHLLRRRLGLQTQVEPVDPLDAGRFDDVGRFDDAITVATSAGSSPSRSSGGFAKQALCALGLEKGDEAIVDSRIFTVVMGCVVILNLITIGLETDLDDGWLYDFVSALNVLFLLAYLVEIFLRLRTHGPEVLWDKLTVMDTLLVSVALIERFMNNSGFARALPAFRLLRLLRVLQQTKMFRYQRELYVLVVSGSRTILILGWMTLVLLVAVLASSSFTKHAIGDSSEWDGSMDPSVVHEPFESFDNFEYFGSVMRSFLTLLQVVTLSQWADLVRRVMVVYPLLFFFFFCFVITTAYGITLVVVANIVGDCLAAAQAAQAAELERKRERRQHFGDQIGRILRLLDRDGDGEVYPEEIEKALSRTCIRALLDELEVPNLDGHSFVRLFDRVGCGTAGIDELVDGFVGMGEDIQPKDYVKLNLWARNLLMRAGPLSSKVGVLSSKVAELRLTLEKAFDALDYYQHTREITELRHRAIKEIRSAPPPEVPKLREWKEAVEPRFPPEDPAKIYISMAGRCMGINGRAPRPGEMLGARRAGLPPAPPRLEREQKRASEEDKQFVDKYWPVPDPERHVLGPSPSLQRVRGILG